jgi:DNA repair exonuclease SbcCD ATPase subunit
MEILINNFRSIDQKNYSFVTGNNLITGESGLGKSTILEAVIWCFYGGTSVTPFTITKKKEITKVEIKYESIIFIRTKPPDKCTVILEDKKLEYDEAQEYINNFLGSKGLWETSSYLKQDNRSNMLFSSSQEKYSLVKELVFGREENINSPENYLKRLNKFSENLEKEYNNTQGKVEVMKENLENLVSEFIRYDEIEKNSKKLKKLSIKYEEIKEGIEKLKIQISEQEKIIEYKAKLEKLNKKIEEFPELSLELIQKWKNWFDCKVELESLDKNFKRIDISNYDEVDLVSNLKNLTATGEKYMTNLNISKELHIEYDENIIKEELISLEDRIKRIKEYQKYSSIINSIQKLKEKKNTLSDKEEVYKNAFLQILEKFNIVGNKYDIENIEKLNQNLNSIMTNYLVCPKCNQNLVIEEDKLVVKKCKFMKKEEIDKIRKNIKNIQIFYKALDSINTELQNYIKIENQMGIPKNLEEVTGDLTKLEIRLKKLKTIEFYKFNKEEVREKENFIKDLRKNIKISKLENIISNNYDTIFDNYEKPENLSQYYKEYQNLTFDIEKNTDYLKDKKEKNTEEMKIKLIKLEDIIGDLDDFKIYEKIVEKKEKLDEVIQVNNTILKKREGCYQIKKIINEESSSTFENLIGNFNDLLNEIVGEIFEDINITIGMFKKLKGKGELKPQFNMKVTLKGNEYDNLNFLSGGEKDRISIALTLTLSTLLNNPIIMFDESMSSLDEEMRERCLDLIKKYASDKILINICHSTIEGYYDNIIRL